MNFPKILQILTKIPGKQSKVLQNSGIPQDFESVIGLESRINC